MLPVFQIPVLTFEILKNQRALTKLNLSFSSLCILTGADRIPVLTLGFDSESQLSEFVWVNHILNRDNFRFGCKGISVLLWHSG